ncbi:hypothetical protein BDF14DRAFT_1826840 [Spinellus fusiger]|nr:hypothetical protein BDF14DRAFT_1826840 [Spinellus fusiger]
MAKAGVFNSRQMSVLSLLFTVGSCTITTRVFWYIFARSRVFGKYTCVYWQMKRTLRNRKKESLITVIYAY